MNTTDELDIITRMRGEVMSRQELTGENLFLAWGYPTAFFLLVEFAALMLWNQDWCAWLWAGIPLVGAPLMIHFLRKDYDRTHSRTHDQKTILVMWIFVGQRLHQEFPGPLPYSCQEGSQPIALLPDQGAISE